MSSAPGPTARGSSLSASAARHRGALAVWALLVAYASLYPFWPLRMPSPDALAVFLRPKVVLEFDVALNAIAYLPLGALACLILLGANSPWSARARAVAGGAPVSRAQGGRGRVVPPTLGPR